MKCTINTVSLMPAMSRGNRSIAFPSISTGIYRFPVDKAARVAVTAVWEFFQSYEDAFDRVVWVLFDENTKKVYDAAAELILR